jgi:hypothetical protein
VALPVFSEPASKYQVGTIMDVKPHQANGNDGSDLVSYDVSVKVGDTIYLTHYAPPFGMNTVKYAAGRDLMVLVGKKTITYNDILGHPVEVPIVGQKSATDVKEAK